VYIKLRTFLYHALTQSYQCFGLDGLATETAHDVYKNCNSNNYHQFI